ncbi:MAG: tyrosine-type recombinase/integrase [Planctomycetes bacterium]|nr:tyrosine-type recombinase/integrase [Planctomycetota bacterium]
MPRPTVYRRNGLYYVNFVRAGKRYRKSLDTDDQTEADRRALAFAVELEQEKDPFRRRTYPVEDFLGEYLTWYEANHTPKSLSSMEGPVRSFFRYVGKEKLGDVTRRDIDGFKASRIGEVAPATVNGELRDIRACLNWAERKEYIDESPARGIEFLKEARNPPRALSRDEMGRLVAAARGTDLDVGIRLGLYLGLRRNELTYAEFSDFRREDNLYVVRNKVEHGFTAKSFEARSIPTTYFTGMQELLYEHQETTGWCIRPQEADRRKVYNTVFNKVFPAVAREAKVEDVTPHDLRKTFASQLASAGVSPWEIRDALGHSTLATTMRYVAFLPRGTTRTVF